MIFKEGKYGRGSIEKIDNLRKHFQRETLCTTFILYIINI